MDLGETIATYDVELALRGEAGKFEVRSPAGEILYVTLKQDPVIEKAGMTPIPTPSQAFLIKKITEPVSMDERAVALASESREAVGAHAPFLIDARSGNESGAESVPLSAHTQSEVWGFELFYSEDTLEKKAPSAFVAVKKAQAEASGRQQMLTTLCGNFNELDSEIRRLHAQLDEICLQAKKRFYKAYAAASA